MIRKTYSIFTLILLLTSIPSFAATIPVTIKDFQFVPFSVTINLGDSVKWNNQGDVPHTTTENSIPDPLWDKTLAPNVSYTRQFNTEGTFNYHCTIHPDMKGKIIVRSAEQSRINIGKSIITANPKKLPITLDLNGKTDNQKNQIYLGSYIVNAQSACADCHSCPTYAPGHNPYKGESKQFNEKTYLAGGVSFGGLISRNLTPNNSGKPAGLTLAEFKSLLRSGHDPDDPPGTLLQVMPWPIYGMMSESDLDAVYRYLSSIPKASTPNPACTTPGQ